MDFVNQSCYLWGIMATATVFLMFKTFGSISPIKYSFLILASSIVTSLLLFHISLISWISLVLIMIFSSGMMTLFIYVSSLSPNEKSKSNYFWLGAFIMLVMVGLEGGTPKISKISMKMFSTQTLLVLMVVILVLSMLVISIQSFNPQQSMSSTF